MRKCVYNNLDCTHVNIKKEVEVSISKRLLHLSPIAHELTSKAIGQDRLFVVPPQFFPYTPVSNDEHSGT